MNTLVCTLEFDGDTLCPRGRLDFDSVVDVEAKGSAWLATQASPQCRVDLSGLEYANSAGIALLLSWRRVAISHQRALVVANTPKHLGAIIELVGLEQVLE